MVNYKMELIYDGTNYFGYQIQNSVPTIQKEVERVLKQMLNLKEITCFASGRTDRGVHANGQVINFFTEKKINCDQFLYSFNRLINHDISGKKLEEVPSDFHARYSAIEKEYIYKIRINEYNPFLRNYEWYIPQKVDFDLIEKAIFKLKGIHDFKAFTVTECKNPSVKNLMDIKIIRNENSICFYFIGNGFLRYMVRTIMGLLIEIGLGKKKLSCIDEAFDTKDRTILGKMAPAQGLYLNRVKYN